MSNTKTTNITITDEFDTITDVDRTVNYIQFQIHQADEMLKEFQGTDARPIQFAPILEWKRKLNAELSEVRKSIKRK